MKCERSSIPRWVRVPALVALALAPAVSLPATAAPPAAAAKIVDINSASRKELKTLPGIGDAEAESIVAHRPYASKTELVGKNVLPMGPYLSIKNRIVALPKGRAKGGSDKTNPAR